MTRPPLEGATAQGTFRIEWVDSDPDDAATMEISCSIPYVYVFDGGKVIDKKIREVPGMVVKGTAKIN